MSPRVIVLDDKGVPLIQGAKKEDKPNKGTFIEGRLHNISADAIEFTNYYKPKEKSPKFLTIKVMELNKENKQNDKNSITEFKVEL